MPVEAAEPQASSSFSSPVSAALTPGSLEEDGSARGSAVCTFPENGHGSEAAAAYPANTGLGEGNIGKLCYVLAGITDVRRRKSQKTDSINLLTWYVWHV